VITDLVLLWTVGIRPVLVHGGGPEINSWLERLGIQPEFKNGLRVTDGEPWWGPVGGCPGGGRR
jgi:acetylglutamate kinase